jgi:signal transduction histidine kinase
MDGMITKQEVTNIKSIVDENIGLLSKSFSQKSIIVESKIDNQVLTWSDKNQIGIVIRNILSNALKFTPENGTITIGANDKNEFWEIWFQDTGVGLTKESLQKIFFKEETFTTYGTNNEKGTGLGLMLCKEMVEKNEGSLRAESIVGKGTCFYCSIPKAIDKLKDLA